MNVKIKIAGKEMAVAQKASKVSSKKSKDFKETKLPNTKAVRDFLNRI